MKGLVTSQIAQQLILSVILISAILMHVLWYLVILICIFLIGNDVSIFSYATAYFEVSIQNSNFVQF